MADVYFAYGKALLENAIVQNSVLGKEQEGGAAAAEEGMCCTVRAGGYCCRSHF
jgi:HAT1-interacting factor 1